MDHDEPPEGEVCKGCGRVHTADELEQMRVAKLAQNFVHTMIVPSVDGFEQRIGANVGSVWFSVFQEAVHQLARYGECPPKVMRDAMRSIVKQVHEVQQQEAAAADEMNAQATAPGTSSVQ